MTSIPWIIVYLLIFATMITKYADTGLGHIHWSKLLETNPNLNLNLYPRIFAE